MPRVRTTSRLFRVPVEELEAAGLPQLAKYLTQLNEESHRKLRTLTFMRDPTSHSALSVETYSVSLAGLVVGDHVDLRPNTIKGGIYYDSRVQNDGILTVQVVNNGLAPVTFTDTNTFKVISTRI
jgi:hypothetical protein